MDPDALTIVVLMAAGFIAGVVDSIAGGGGLITIPALLFAGASPVSALGTNKLQAMFGSGTAAVSYARSGAVVASDMKTPILLAAAASAVGAVVANILDPALLNVVIPVALIAIAVFFTVKPSLDDQDSEARMEPAVFALTLVPLIGFYDGVLGPGTGSFFMIALVGLAGYGVLRATASTKVLNFASNVGGFAVFVAVGVIHWRVGLAMGVAEIAGAAVGSRLALANGARLIKPLLVTTCVAMALRLLL